MPAAPTASPEIVLGTGLQTLAIGRFTVYGSFVEADDNNVLPATPLSPIELSVLDRASFGDNTKEAAQYIDATLTEVEDARLTLMDKYKVRKLAPAINNAILGQAIELTIPTKPKRFINGNYLRLFAHIASGHSNGCISKNFGLSNPIVRFRKSDMYRSVGASGENSAVRRFYELGLVKPASKKDHVALIP